jgi:hypothetical protein
MLSTMSAVNDVNRVNDVNDVKTPTPAAFGGVSGRGRLRRRLVVRPPAAAFRLSRRLRRRFGGWPPAAAGFSDVIDVIDAVDVIDSGRG